MKFLPWIVFLGVAFYAYYSQNQAREARSVAVAAEERATAKQGEAVSMERELQNVKQKLESLEAEHKADKETLAELRAGSAAAAMEIEKAKQVAEQAKLKSEEQGKGQMAEADILKNSVQLLETQLQAAKTEAEAAKSQLEAAKVESASATAQINAMQAELKRLKERPPLGSATSGTRR